MKLSIITINYNNLEGLKKTFESIVCQTFADYEWIIIDGGSTDGSKEFIEQHQERFAYWCSEPDGGIYQALNKGVGFAKGEYVSFMNAGDMYADAQTLHLVFSIPQSADILYGNVVIDQDDERKEIVYPDLITFNWLRYYTINHQSTFTRRQVFSSIQFDVKYKYLADRKFWMESMFRGCTFKHLPLTIAIYDYNGYSTQNIEKWEAERKAICDEVIPEGLKEDLEFGYIYKMHPDLHKAYSLLSQHGPCRKILHLCIKTLGLFKKKH